MRPKSVFKFIGIPLPLRGLKGQSEKSQARDCYDVYPSGRASGMLKATNMTAKQQIQALLEKLPDTCSLEDIQYHLYVLEKVSQGLQDAQTHGGLTQEDAESRLSKWLKE